MQAPEPANSSEPQRRLAAILAADIAGYSALMGADEQGTVRELRSHQAVILSRRPAPQSTMRPSL
jgi:class 3 adenylate cyclase